MTSTDVTEVPAFPMARATGCPFDPPQRLAALQEEAPLARVKLWDGSTPWVVTRYAEQRTLLRDPRISADPRRPGYPSGAPPRPNADKGPTIVFKLMDDPEHARLRGMVTAPFATKRILQMRPAIQRIVDDLIDGLLAGPRPVDLVEAFALPIPSMVICELLGVPYQDHDLFQHHSRTLISRSASPAARQGAIQALHGYLEELMGRKIAEPRDDLLSALVPRIANGEISRSDAAGMGGLLLVGGHDTTANMIALGTLALLDHPEQLAKLRDGDDPKRVASAVEELLRYLSIAHNGRRRVALEDIEIAGETIRAGEGLIMANDIGNRDATVFPDPDTLDLDRDASGHVAFGFGVHQCLGQPLARMQLQVVYGTLYRRIPTLKLATTVDKVPFKHDGGVYGVYELPVTW